jgi:hypothetical protein
MGMLRSALCTRWRGCMRQHDSCARPACPDMRQCFPQRRSCGRPPIQRRRADLHWTRARCGGADTSAWRRTWGCTNPGGATAWGVHGAACVRVCGVRACVVCVRVLCVCVRACCAAVSFPPTADAGAIYICSGIGKCIWTWQYNRHQGGAGAGEQCRVVRIPPTDTWDEAGPWGRGHGAGDCAKFQTNATTKLCGHLRMAVI